VSAIWQLVRQLSNILHSNREGLLAVICKYIALLRTTCATQRISTSASSAWISCSGGGKLGQEDWATLPLDKGWEDAEAVGTELSMIALRRDDFVLALKAIASS